MDREETVKFYEECLKKERLGNQKSHMHWNKWANDMLTERKQLEESGGWEAKREDWEKRARADFSGYKFKRHLNFSKFVFPGIAFFHEVTFSGMALFSGATFSGTAFFDNATFSGGAEFSGATFSDTAWFYEATFSGGAKFCNVVFEGNALFSNTLFEDADFFCINSKAGFELSGAEFAVAPSFIQAHFLEAPGLDGVVIPEDVPCSPSLRGAKGDEAIQSEADSGLLRSARNDITARYRALKRMAIQAHDHERERNFFAAELKSMRGTEHQPPFGKNWGWWVAGHIYESLSDFGRSPRRVLEWMFGQWFVFTQLFGLAAKDPVSCALGDGNVVYPALSLSAGNTLFPFMSHSDKAKEYLFCLFDGQHEGEHGRWVPAMTDWYAFLSTTQSLFSLLLIFLLLLSIRAHFRVK